MFKLYTLVEYFNVGTEKKPKTQTRVTSQGVIINELKHKERFTATGDEALIHRPNSPTFDVLKQMSLFLNKTHYAHYGKEAVEYEKLIKKFRRSSDAERDTFTFFCRVYMCKRKIRRFIWIKLGTKIVEKKAGLVKVVFQNKSGEIISTDWKFNRKYKYLRNGMRTN